MSQYEECEMQHAKTAKKCILQSWLFRPTILCTAEDNSHVMANINKAEIGQTFDSSLTDDGHHNDRWKHVLWTPKYCAKSDRYRSKRVKVQGALSWPSSMSKLYAYCMQQYGLCKGSCSASWELKKSMRFWMHPDSVMSDRFIFFVVRCVLFVVWADRGKTFKLVSPLEIPALSGNIMYVLRCHTPDTPYFHIWVIISVWIWTKRLCSITFLLVALYQLFHEEHQQASSLLYRQETSMNKVQQNCPTV